MAEIINMAKHVWFRCPPGLDKCIEGRCMFCSGGLAYCTTCKGGEGTLPTDCPGEPMSDAQLERVWRSEIDYKRKDGWVCLEVKPRPPAPSEPQTKSWWEK